MSLDEAIRYAAPSRKHLRVAAFIGLALAVAILAIGLGTRAHSNAQLRTWTDDQAVPSVSVVRPAELQGESTLRLPGRVEAFSRAAIHARVGGYLREWNVDIGAHVKTGQVLAVIDTPDLDQQLAQAKADLSNAEASAALAESTSKRWSAMLNTDSVSRQEVDEKLGDYASKRALVNSARANVERLEALESFKRILAPFDGTITSRSAEVGQLITAENNSGPELFTVSDTHRLRIYVSVPQSYAPRIKAGMSADLTVPERPDQTFTATVESTSNAVDTESGSVLVQLSVDNANGELLAGSYADVRLNVQNNGHGLQLPASALIFDAEGMRVASVGENNRVVMKKIQIARDDGATVEIAAGLDANDRIIDSPPDAIASGMQVRVAPTRESAATAASK